MYILIGEGLRPHTESGLGQDAPYETIVRELERELRIPFADPKDPGLYERGQRLRALFASFAAASPSGAKQLYRELGEKSTEQTIEALSLSTCSFYA